LPRERRQEIRPHARRYVTIEIQAGPHTISAAGPLPDDLRHAIETIARARAKPLA
jgi:hypothetical protein